ncbi:hypothetical protein QFZ29_000782 [Agromyces albus]|nr:hypothetical protein [Agromyces albus]
MNGRESADGFFGRFAVAAVAAYPVLWVLGGAGAFWILLAIPAVVYLLQNRIPAVAWLSISVALCLLLSWPIGIVQFGFQAGRSFSLLANVAVWLVVAALLSVAYRSAALDRMRESVAIVCAVQGALIFVSSQVFPARLPIPIFGHSEQLGAGFAAFGRNTLYQPGWLGEITFRSAGIMAQPTWSGAIAAIGIAASVPLIAQRGRRVLGLLGVLGSFVAIDLALSRSVSVCLVLALVVGLVVHLRNRSPLAFFTAVTLGSIGITIVLITKWAALVEFVFDLNAQRAGSLDARGAIYSRTLELIAVLPIPILGYGIKPQESDLVASVATHSTLLGLLFRGGVLALAAFLLLCGYILWAAYKARNGYAFGIMVFVLGWSVLEDLDPGHLVPLGLVIAWVSILRKREVLPGAAPETEARSRPLGGPRSRLRSTPARRSAQPVRDRRPVRGATRHGFGRRGAW